MIPPRARPRARALWHLGVVYGAEVSGFSREIALALCQGSADAGEEVRQDLVVVDLQERPAEHLARQEQVLHVCAVVVRAGVAGAVGAEGREGGLVC